VKLPKVFQPTKRGTELEFLIGSIPTAQAAAHIAEMAARIEEMITRIERLETTVKDILQR